MSERILVFIPTYNCEKQITRVLRQFDADTAPLFSQIIVVDNGSKDKTVECATAAAKTALLPVTIIKNDQNYSLGGSTKAAFLYALDHGFDYVVTLHGDDQADIHDMIAPIRAGLHRTHDYLIGARFHPRSVLSGYSRFRIFGNIVFNTLFSFVTGRKIYDMVAGLNIYNIKYLRTLFFLPLPCDLTYEQHSLLYAVYKKVSFDYVPISWREQDQLSNARVFKQSWILIKMLWGFAFGSNEKLYATNRSGYPIDFRYPGTIIYNSGRDQAPIPVDQTVPSDLAQNRA
jgi:dolichol-phosphate mannosyltransferase